MNMTVKTTTAKTSAVSSQKCISEENCVLLSGKEQTVLSSIFCIICEEKKVNLVHEYGGIALCVHHKTCVCFADYNNVKSYFLTLSRLKVL